MTPLNPLRAGTAHAHEAVDAAFGVFSLTDRGDYVRLLTAHARALPAAEAVLERDGEVTAIRSRAGLLARDLAALGHPLPPPLPFDPPGGHAGRWGVLYVVEGSRLGGSLIARGVPEGFPSAYFAASHLPGEWRALLAEIDARVASEGEDWVADALAGAHACFDLYRRAADLAQAGRASTGTVTMARSPG